MMFEFSFQYYLHVDCADLEVTFSQFTCVRLTQICESILNLTIYYYLLDFQILRNYYYMRADTQ